MHDLSLSKEANMRPRLLSCSLKPHLGELRSSTWWLQWLCLTAAAPWLVVDVSRGWIGAALLGAQQVVRLLDASERQRHFDLDVAWPLFGLGAMAAVGLAVSPDIQISLPKFYGLLFGLGVYVGVVSFVRSAQPGTPQVRRLWIAASIYLTAGLLVAVGSFLLVSVRPTNSALLTALYDARPHLPIQVSSSQGVVLKDGIHPNEVAGTLTLFAPFYLALLLYRPWHKGSSSADSALSQLSSRTWVSICLTTVSFVGLVVVSGVLVSTLSRTAVVAIGLSAIFLVWCRWRIARPGLAALVLGSESFVALSLAGFSPFGLDKKEIWYQVMRLVGGTLQMTRPELSPWATTSWRIELWSKAVSLLGQHPWTGIGLNALPLFLQSREARVIAVTGVDLGQVLQKQEMLIPHAHDLFLQVALDFGIPGLIAFLMLGVVVLYRLFRAHQYFAWNSDYALFAGISATLLAYLIFNLPDAIALGAKPGVFQWALLGFAVSLPASRRARTKGQAQAVPGIEGVI